MKKVFKYTALALALTAGHSATAAEFTFDESQSGDINNGITVTDMVTETFQAISYYADGNDNGTVETGEFVFDFGLGIDVTGFSPAQGVPGYLTDWKFQMDYLLYGSAIVERWDDDEFEYVVDDSYDDFGTFSTPFGEAPNENLSAFITDGMINLFVGEMNTNEKMLAASYEVNSLAPDQSAGSIVLDMEGTGIYAVDDFFYNAQGVEFNDALDNGANWSVSLTSQFQTNPSDQTWIQPIPGQYNPNNEASFGTVDGVDLAYFGQNATQVTSAANDCPDGTFGYCGGSQASIPFDPVTTKWREVRDTIRAAAGNSELLARSTALGSRLTQNVPEPGPLSIFAASLLGLAFLRKSKKA
jgi:hypothetical protein